MLGRGLTRNSSPLQAPLIFLNCSPPIRNTCLHKTHKLLPSNKSRIRRDIGPSRLPDCSDVVAGGRSGLAQFYFSNWVTPCLSFVIFVLFGFTPNARSAYMIMLRWIGDLLRIRPIIRRHQQRLKHKRAAQKRERTRRGLGSMPQEITLDSELWCARSLR